MHILAKTVVSYVSRYTLYISKMISLLICYLILLLYNTIIFKGTTIFIARHREWFFQGGNTKCTNCGATGEDNFEEIREDIIDSIDDDYFDYESPLDFVSAAERRRLVKKAGGDEELAKQMAIDNAMANDKDQVQKSESSGDDKPAKKKKSSKKKKKSSESEKKQPEKKTEPADDLDELDMDF